jgi:hypothetical protein
MEPEPIDVRHLGRERVICCGRVGDVLIDPGPESAMGTLIEALDDVDLEARNESLSLIADWAPQSLGITHFGAVGDVFEHLAAVRDRLAARATLARELDGEAYEAHIRREVAEAADADTAAALNQAVPPEQQWLGLDRYWRKREG